MKYEYITRIKNSLRVNTHMQIALQDDSGIQVPVYTGYVPLVLGSMSEWLEHAKTLSEVYDSSEPLGYPEINEKSNSSRVLKAVFNGDGPGEGEDVYITFQLNLDSLELNSEDMADWLDAKHR